MVALTGRDHAYYSDYRGEAQEFISAVKWGCLYQGQRYRWQKKRRGTPRWIFGPRQFVTFLQNHDQIANSGRRCALPSVDKSRPIQGDDGPLAARPQPRCCFKVKSSLLPVRSFFLRITSRTWRA